jgi:predicted DNA-binding protein (UPF0251 family)
MSPRLKKLRKVLNPPPIKGFKPYGPDVEGAKVEPVLLHFEEYEALRLCDYDMYNHHQASVLMGVSRPTFTRIYASVRQKVAVAFAEGRQIVIDGGKVYFDSDWYKCNQCKCFFNNPQKEIDITNCPLCGGESIKGYEVDSEMPEGKEVRQYVDLCICPRCGFEREHQFGRPCSQEVCPECQSPMRRKGRSNRRRNLN